ITWLRRRFVSVKNLVQDLLLLSLSIHFVDLSLSKTIVCCFYDEQNANENRFRVALRDPIEAL
ncbi:hypothetical protein U1Q18_012803, partial [Sarracenia purpurea var. burkii]